MKDEKNSEHLSSSGNLYQKLNSSSNSSVEKLDSPRKPTSDI
jgi:hypothetical protein